MPVVFPVSLDTSSTFPAAPSLASESLADEPHSRLHGDIGAAVMALEAKVGVNSSSDPDSLDYKTNHVAAGVPTGALFPFGGPTAPTGYLLCFGQQVSTTTYADLFAVLGSTYGTGAGTFGLPDLRGRAVAGKDDMGGSAAGRLTSAIGGITATSLGASGGNQSIQSHTHGITDPSHAHTYTDPGHAHPVNQIALFGTNLQTGGGSAWANVNTSTATTNITIQPTSTGITGTQSFGSGTTQNVQPTIILNYIVKI